nr:shufflon system plasmid conjugative transfer pilus tip adhesin PilV [Aquabacterium terrae]
MGRRSRGFTLIEILAALAIGALMTAGLVKLLLSSIEDTRGTQAALHQGRVTAAAQRYITTKRDVLLASATAVAPARVTVADLKTAGFLSTSLQATNAFGQTPCVLVLQPSAGVLEALVVTEGGVAVPQKDLALVAANAGEGSGYIAYGAPTVAQGAFGSWSLSTAALSKYLASNCTGTVAAAGRLASAIFFVDGSNAASDFVYRAAVPGHPELNRMSTPLHMAAVAVADTSDARCVAADVTTQGRIAVDATGRVLSCQAGVWRKQGSAWWKDPVANHVDLPASDNVTGDVRMVTALSRAFTWTGTAWVALSVDENGNLTVPGTVTANAVDTGTVQLNTVVVRETPCASAGLIARDAAGLPLVCTGGVWRSTQDELVGATVFQQDYNDKPAHGTKDFYAIDLRTLPGPRPLFITGYSYCDTTGSSRALAVAEPFDAGGGRLGYSGGCGAISDAGGSRVFTKGVIPLVKLPANAVFIRVYMEPGTADPDHSWMRLQIKASQ